MKKFDKDSIKERYVESLRNSGQWNRFLEDSAVSLLLDVLAERDAETYRYFEYLLREAKWSYAQNITSLLSQCQYFGYKPRRKIAAAGEVVISHDPRLQGAGVTFFESELETLTPYGGFSLFLPPGTLLSNENESIYVITAKQMIYPPGAKYIRVPVIQGIIRSFKTSGGALGIPFEKLRIYDSGFEAALDATTSSFLKVQLYIGGNLNSTPVPVNIKDHILLASTDEYACDINTASDFSYVEIRFGDGSAGKLLPKDSIVEVIYINTLGEQGNISEKYQITRFHTIFSSQTPLYCTNFDPILGGKDHDTAESIRAQAPVYYLTSQSIITTPSYKQAVLEIPYVHQATVYPGTYTDPRTNTPQNAILFSAINTEGDAIDEHIIEEDFRLRTYGKRSPLDFFKYEPPQFLQLGINITARTTTQNIDLIMIEEEIREKLYAKYGVLNQSFKESFDFSYLQYFVREIGKKGDTETLIQINTFIEAICDLKPSTFLSSGVVGYFIKNFKFDPSFLRFKGFDDGVLYCLKIQIRFNCPGCEEKSRTLFLVKNENYDPSNPASKIYKLIQYPYIPEITSYSYMQTSVLNPLTVPYEIPPTISGQPNPNYIPFEVDYPGYYNNPGSLGEGTLHIPLRMTNPDGSPGDFYINFTTPDRAELDRVVSIKVYAIPFELDIIPQKENNIFKVDKSDILIKLFYAPII